MIRLLKSSDYTNFLNYTSRYNSDFYIFDGKRKFLSDTLTAKKVFNTCLKHGGFSVIQEENGIITGIAILVKEGNDRFLKILGNTSRISENLFQVLCWNNPPTFNVRVKKNNFLYRICNGEKYRFGLDKYGNFRKFGFKFVKEENKEVIFSYIPNPQKYTVNTFKDND